MKRLKAALCALGCGGSILVAGGVCAVATTEQMIVLSGIGLVVAFGLLLGALYRFFMVAL